MFEQTQEQLNCIDTARNNKHIIIEALAGAAKTSTLVLIAKEIVQPSIYLAFNKVTAVEAEGKFPSHVSCRTTHSVAYEAFGMEIAHKLKRPSTHYVNVAGTGSEVAKFYKVKPIFKDDKCIYTSAALGMYIKNTVAKFEQSADTTINMSHCVYHKEMSKPQKESILASAKKMWKDRINPSSKVLATHDTYLKLYQLSKPILEYSVVYVDEYQDSTACVIDIVANQKHAKIVVVGDSRQAIYQWRGSTNGLETFQGITCYLSRSFRFGQKIADIAQKVLKNKVKVFGTSSIDSKVGFADSKDVHTIIFRTNSALLTDAVEAIEKGTSVGIEIDVKDFVGILKSVIALKAMDTKNVKHEKILPYTEFKDLEEEAKNDSELKRVVQLVNSGKSLRSIALLESYTNPKNPQILFTTAHKSKGREWDNVLLANDFPSHYNSNGEWVGLQPMEENLLYVACTRAKLLLQINESVTEAIDYLDRKELL